MSSPKLNELWKASKNWEMSISIWHWPRKTFCQHCPAAKQVCWEISSAIRWLLYNMLSFHVDIGYTFFAPTNWAFVRMMPQDIADPFHVDTELRTTVLLHHFVRQKLSTGDLLKKTELMMADKKPSTLTRSSSPSKPFASLTNLTT